MTRYVKERTHVKKAYLAGAEPREKQIVELEKENEMLRQGYIADKGEWVKRTDVLDKLEQAKLVMQSAIDALYSGGTDIEMMDKCEEILRQFIEGRK